MAIKLLKEKKKPTTKKRVKPYYLMVFNYMIGDSNGYTSEEVKLSVDNPHIEKTVKLLNKLKPVKGTWGIVLDQKYLERAFNEQLLTKANYDFLNNVLFYWDNDGEEGEGEDKFASEFSDAVRSSNEYSFLVFEGVDLYYYDEKGKKHKTKV